MNKKNNFRTLERLVRGFANHKRMEILELIKERPELSVTEIAEAIRMNIKTAADHIRRLTIAGMLLKKGDGAAVRHKLTDRAEHVLRFLKSLE